MATNSKFQHVAVRLPSAVVAVLQERRDELGARSLTGVARKILEDHVEEQRPADLRITQSSSDPRTDLWLPRSLVGQLREVAGTRTRVSNLILAMLTPIVPPADGLALHDDLSWSAEDPPSCNQPPPTTSPSDPG